MTLYVNLSHSQYMIKVHQLLIITYLVIYSKRKSPEVLFQCLYPRIKDLFRKTACFYHRNQVPTLILVVYWIPQNSRYFWGRGLQCWRILIGQVLAVFFFFFFFWWATFLPFTSRWLLCFNVDPEMRRYDIYDDMIWYFNGIEIWHIYYKDLTHLADVPDVPQMHDPYKLVTIWKGNRLAFQWYQIQCYW